MEKCHFGKAPSLALVEQTYGRQTATSWLEIQLNNLSEFAGCKEKMTTAQIAETAAMILDGYPHYKLTEFMLFFQRFKRCEYGKFYGAVDPMVIFQALVTFNEQRARAIQARADAKRQQRQAAEDTAAEQLRQRYTARVPDAWTEHAPLSFLQYRLMGYDVMTYEKLQQEISAIRIGEKKVPKDIESILKTINQTQNNP